MDVEDIIDYFFDIIVWDNGKFFKLFFFISLECEVDDVNEFILYFLKDIYEVTINRGRIYINII